MKIIITLLFIVTTLQNSFGQSDKERLLKEISKSKEIECAYLGMGGRNSELFRKADTLNTLTTLSEKFSIVMDSNYILKYYTFKYLLYMDEESLSFRLLKQFINDTTELFYECSCQREYRKFNELLTFDYYKYITAKYYNGGGQMMGDDYKAFIYPKSDKRAWKTKAKELKQLIIDSKQTTLLQSIESYNNYIKSN